MQKITVTIHWSDPDELCQITADHIKTLLSRYCTNTTFEVEASRDSRQLSALPSDVIHKGALEWADLQMSDGQVRKDLIHDFEVGAKWAIQKMIERGIAV